MVRELLVGLLAREPDFSVVGDAGNGQEAIELAQSAQPDVLVLDIALPGLDGVEVARSVRVQQPQIRILALSVHADARFIHQLLNAGADGYVGKSSPVAELVRGIRTVMQGDIYLSPAIARQVLRGYAVAKGSVVVETALGRRELQVLALLADGKRSQEIAGQLEISIATVESHRRNIMRKLGLHTIAELTKYALRKGLTSL
jgi:DNA-binding NarL/FixJ family response regulator